MQIKGIDKYLIKYVKERDKYGIEELHAGFLVNDFTKLVDERLPYSRKESTEEELGDLLTIDEYFNTKTDTSVYCQIRTSRENTFRYPTDEELNILIDMFGLDNVIDEEEFRELRNENNEDM